MRRVVPESFPGLTGYPSVRPGIFDCIRDLVRFEHSTAIRCADFENLSYLLEGVKMMQVTGYSVQPWMHAFACSGALFEQLAQEVGIYWGPKGCSLIS